MLLFKCADEKRINLQKECHFDRAWVDMSVVRKRNLLHNAKLQLQIAEDFSSFLVRNDNLFISSAHLFSHLHICIFAHLFSHSHIYLIILISLLHLISCFSASQLIHTNRALPTIWSSGTNPQKRESSELWRLSPIIK
jgi:hypothetical protein